MWKLYNHILYNQYLAIFVKFQSKSNKMQCYTVFYFWNLHYMFWVDPPSIIRSLTLYLQQTVTATCRYRGIVETPQFQLFHDSGR
jgi:hypothetical protein